jgi:pyruvate,water dikinase
MTRARHLPGAARLAARALALACALLPGAAPAGGFSTVEPAQVLAGSFYDGATLRVTGSIDEHAQVAIRLTGPLERHAFNRRGKIGGVIWGGVEHVTFENAPGLYAVYTSGALRALAPRAVREQQRLGYDTLAAHMAVRRAAVPAGQDGLGADLIQQLVRLKESEGLYRVAPGAVHLGDPAGGRRTFEVAIPLPATTPPGEIDVAVLELAGGAVVREDASRVTLQRVGMPDFLFRLAHQRGTAFGLLAVFALVVTGVGVDLLGTRRHKRPHPAVVLLTGIARGVDDAVLPARQRPRSPEQVERMLSKYRLFRTLLALNNEVLEHLSDLEEESSWTSFHHSRVRMGIRALFDGTADMVGVLNELTSQRYFDLANVVATLRADVFKFLEKASERRSSRLVLRRSEVGTDTADQVGDKAVHLARIECDLHVRVPEWFSVTIEAYREFLEHAGLASQLRTILAPARLDAPDDFRRRCELAQELVRAAEVPPAISEAILEAHRACGLAEREGLAVRSSAAGEGGGALSFAGQFETFLNVRPSGLVEAWKGVVASRFSPRAVFYRRAAGLADVDTPMSVLVQRMVRARASGVLFTRPPDDPKGGDLLVTSGAGLGPDVSAGIASADTFVVSRVPPHRIVERRIAPKRARLVEATEGGLARLALDGAEQLQASLADAEVVQLAEVGLAIERYFGKPQDIEWVVDGDGKLSILQARPLRTERPEQAAGEVPDGARLVLRGGEPIWHGRAVGRVYVARTPREEEETPAGALLVVPQLLPDCVRLLPRVCGIVAERGTVTGHAASILREFRVPSLFGAKGALEALAPGRMMSLDVGSRAVYDGALWPELRGRTRAVGGEQALGLPDPLAGKLTKLSGTAFIGTWACQSLHDVVRFAHEMAIQSMFDIGDRLLESPIGGVKKVESAQPLFVHVLDLGGGIVPAAAAKESVSPAEIASAPFLGLWRGLADANFHPRRLERAEPSPSILAATRAMSGPSELGVPNYACITDSYLNLNARGGMERDPLRVRPRRQACHFVVVDSFLSESPNENHIRMRFRGGGAAPWQRRLRAEVAAEILRQHRFTSTVTGDLVNAWVRGVDRATGQDQLATIGRLLRFLARLDMWMTEEADVKLRVDAFADAEAEALAPRTGPGKATA